MVLKIYSYLVNRDSKAKCIYLLGFTMSHVVYYMFSLPLILYFGGSLVPQIIFIYSSLIANINVSYFDYKTLA